jgi:hypothetical protein
LPLVLATERAIALLGCRAHFLIHKRNDFAAREALIRAHDASILWLGRGGGCTFPKA